MKNLFNLRRAFVTVAALAVCSFAALGQTVDANLVGTVSDPSGAAVASAKVTATNTSTNVPYETTTNSDGEYRLNNVPVGKYDVNVMATGFSPRTQAGVQLDLNHTSQINFTLNVGNVNTQVEVTETPALIETTSSNLQSTYDSTIAIDVPLAATSKTVNGAGIYNLSLLGAGVASSGGVGQGTGPAIAGQRPENNWFSVDGVVNNNTVTTGPLVYVSNEATQELNIQLNQFSAEFGGGSGGVFNLIVKTGTNSLHGSIFEYMQNRDLNAVDYSVVAAGGLRHNTRFDNNRFGAGVGGPIIKNKLFYYGNYEYSPLGQASNPGNPVDVPTAAGISLLNGMSNLSKTNLGVFEKYVPVAQTVDPTNPSTLVNGVSIPLGALSFASPNYNNAYHGIVAIDYNIGNKDQLRGRYIYDKTAGLDFNANLPVFYQPNPITNKSVSVSEFHNFSPTLENELRLSYTRNNAQISAGNYTFPGLSAFPNLSFDDLGLQLGPDPNTPSGQIANTSSLQDNLTKTWGKHTFKGGYTLVDNIVSGFFIQRVRGDYDYLSLEQYLLDQQPSGSAFGTPNSGERSVGAAGGIPLGNLEHAAYFQDDFRVRSNLTLNLGVRYEYVTIPVGTRAQGLSAAGSVPGVLNISTPTPNKNEWSPRIGFAYSPGTDGKTSIRGGVARSFDNTYLNLNENSAPPFYQTTQDVNPAAPVSNFLANGGLAGIGVGATTPAAIRAGISSYTFPQNRPYALTGNLGVQRLIGKDYTVEARYVYTKGVHLWNQTRLNIESPVVYSGLSLPTYFTTPTAAQLAGDTTTLGQIQSVIVPGGTAARPYNNLAAYGFNNALVGYNPWGNSRYNGLALQLNKRYSKNFQYILAWTWSHAQDDSTATNFSTIMSPRRGLDFQNIAREWADSALDRRHRITFTPVYDFKPFQKSNWLLKNVVGNWNISGTYTFQSPEYATVENGIDANMNSDATGDRPMVNINGAANVGSGILGVLANGSTVTAPTSCYSGNPGIVAYVAINPNARFVQAGCGVNTNGGRNTFAMGRENNIDMALMKKINFTERFALNFGAQAFNLFNHSQFTGGFLSDVTPFQTNTISSAVFTVNNARFGQINNFFPSNSRLMQLVARFTF